MSYAADLHRKGNISAIQAMESKAKARCRGTKGGLATAFITEGYQGADCVALIANTQAFTKQEGYIVWDELVEKAVFVGE